ncbi:hypothetical protein M0Q50_07655 [bacterium]|nr:hypothetical protein [bacterium]
MKSYTENQFNMPLISTDYSSGQTLTEKFPSLLPLSIQVASKTIGFDLVSVQPMSAPSYMLSDEEIKQKKLLEKTISRKKKLKSLGEESDTSEESEELEKINKKSGLNFYDFKYITSITNNII